MWYFPLDTRKKFFISPLSIRCTPQTGASLRTRSKGEHTVWAVALSISSGRQQNANIAVSSASESLQSRLFSLSVHLVAFLIVCKVWLSFPAELANWRHSQTCFPFDTEIVPCLSFSSPTQEMSWFCFFLSSYCIRDLPVPTERHYGFYPFLKHSDSSFAVPTNRDQIK